MDRGRVGEDRGSKETDGCPLTLPGLKATASIRNGGMGDGLYDFCTFDFAHCRFYCCIYL
jgi:hypothetical protein